MKKHLINAQHSRRGWLVIGTLLSAALVSGGCGDETTSGTGGGPKDYSDVLALTGDAASGSIIYGQTCGEAPCHNADGDGSAVGAGNLAEAIPSLDDNTLAGIILDGTGNMSAVNISKQDTADVIAHLRATFP